MDGDRYIRKTIPLDLYAVSILLSCVHRGRQHPQVGFEDADNTFKMLKGKLNKIVNFPLEAVESAMWSANLLNEAGDFSHPEGKSFDEFVGDAFGSNWKFDREYNWLDER